MIRRRHRTLSLLAITALMLACVPSIAPVGTSIPTFDPNSPLTSIVQTADAAATQTAVMMPPASTPTDTALPTDTPTETPTPTFVFLLPTLTVRPTQATPGSSGKQYECQIMRQDPANETVMPPETAFEMTWEVANIGQKAWFESDTDYRYSSGYRLHLQAAYDFDASIAPGGLVELKAVMKAPAQPGTYTTEWRINIGKNSFCPMKFTVIVN
ncbi:MAG: hypothetical protein C4557_08030 [Anaerolineaceae bacterium]|jgi:hypothetical protein|nr:MAG: hypothetical protein C4557_08030 [Anaerolineaceae bacterium]